MFYSKVGSDVNLKSLCRSNDPDMPTIWYGQDANGAIWKLDIVASHTVSISDQLTQCSYFQSLSPY